MVNPILGTGNADDVDIYVCMVYSFFDKKSKKYNIKKDNSKCAKFTIKN